MPEFVQALEARRMCSTTAVQLAVGGLLAEQIREAYGFDQVQFSKKGEEFAGNGAGQTIAIVDPFHAPNLKKDLKVFDKQFGISNHDSHGNFCLERGDAAGQAADRCGMGAGIVDGYRMGACDRAGGAYPSRRGQIRQHCRSFQRDRLRQRGKASSRCH